YPIALGFKLIGRCRSKEDALFMTTLFNAFIDDLNMNNEKKEKLKMILRIIGYVKSGLRNSLMLEDYQLIMNHCGLQIIIRKGLTELLKLHILVNKLS